VKYASSPLGWPFRFLVFRQLLEAALRTAAAARKAPALVIDLGRKAAAAAHEAGDDASEMLAHCLVGDAAMTSDDAAPAVEHYGLARKSRRADRVLPLLRAPHDYWLLSCPCCALISFGRECPGQPPQ